LPVKRVLFYSGSLPIGNSGSTLGVRFWKSVLPGWFFGSPVGTAGSTVF